jgi:hypothetical protein
MSWWRRLADWAVVNAAGEIMDTFNTDALEGFPPQVRHPSARDQRQQTMTMDWAYHQGLKLRGESIDTSVPYWRRDWRGFWHWVRTGS